MPHTTGQYLIIENAEEFSNFKLEVQEVKSDGSKIRKESLRLLKTNFYYLKTDYFDYNNGNFEVVLTAYNATGNIADEVIAPLIADNSQVLRSFQWKCVSPSYAFGLTASQQEGNDSF